MRLLIMLKCLVLALSAQPAIAQSPPCAPRAQMLESLSVAGQSRHAFGLAGRAVVELFVAPDDAARWAVSVTWPDGRMCLLARGIGFQAKPGLCPAQGVPL
ncbi:MAG: hypothetical protein JJT99_07425 [Rhodobacteraceae bacterium]|nr:hypothetical protein [Paracoccaceae bacterium]